jgi:hypothetical protein
MKRSISNYLKEDRQWVRPQRIEHVQNQLQQAETNEDKEFWLAILAANGVTIQRRSKRKVAA